MRNLLTLFAKTGLLAVLALPLAGFIAPAGDIILDPPDPVPAKKCCQPRSIEPAPDGENGDGCFTACTDTTIVCDPAATVTVDWVDAKCCSHSKEDDSTCNKGERKLHPPMYICAQKGCTFDHDDDDSTPNIAGSECEWGGTALDTDSNKAKTKVCSGTLCASLGVSC